MTTSTFPWPAGTTIPGSLGREFYAAYPGSCAGTGTGFLRGEQIRADSNAAGKFYLVSALKAWDFRSATVGDGEHEPRRMVFVSRFVRASEITVDHAREAFGAGKVIEVLNRRGQLTSYKLTAAGVDATTRRSGAHYPTVESWWRAVGTHAAALAAK